MGLLEIEQIYKRIYMHLDEDATFAGENTKKIADGCVGKVKWEYYELQEDTCILWTYHPRGMITRDGVKVTVEGLYPIMSSYQGCK